MSEVTSATPANRQIPAKLRDRRLITGVLLIVVSMVATFAVVSNAQQEDEFYVADRTLVPGEPLTKDDLRPVSAQLGEQSGKYLMTADDVDTDLTVVSVVPEGHFIAIDDVAPLSTTHNRTIGIPVESSVTHGISRGSMVEVWHLPSARGIASVESAMEPQLISAEAIVVDVTDSGGGLMSVSQTMIYVDVIDDDVVQLLQALSSDGDFALLAVTVSTP